MWSESCSATVSATAVGGLYLVLGFLYECGMRIRVADIPIEGRELNFDLSPRDLNARLQAANEADSGSQGLHVPSYVFVGSPHSQVKLEPEGNSVQVTGAAEASYKTVCSRCAEDVEKLLKVRLNIIVKPHTERARDSEVDELSLAYYDGEEMDCGELVEEYLLLALPYTVLCQDSCKGLCPKCGQNLNVSQCGCPKEAGGDERFAVLRNLKLN